MAKKIVRLTESDLIRLVKRVMKEQESDQEIPFKRVTFKMKPDTKGILGHLDSWFDENDTPVDPEEFEHDEEIEFGPDDFEEFISQTERDFPKNKWSFSMKDPDGDRTGGKGYWDRYTRDDKIRIRKKR